jgi:hypothetical protein
MSVQAAFTQFVQFYDSEIGRTGVKPDHTSTRESRIAFLQAVLKRYCSPNWAMKRGDPGRPISDEVVVWVVPGPDYRMFGDFIVSGGTAGWTLTDHLEGKLPLEQPLVNPVTLERLPEQTLAPTAPGCTGPTPPAPSLPTYPGDEVFDQIGVALFADYARAGQPPNPGMGRWFGRTTFDYLAGMPMEQSLAKHRAEWKAALGLP